MERHLVFLEGNIVKMVLLPKLIYRVNTIPAKILVAFLEEIDKLILKLRTVKIIL